MTNEQRYILYGDLFKTGGCFALMEIAAEIEGAPRRNHSRVALAEWVDARWKLRGLWDFPAVWRPKGWEEGGDDYLPATPATEPFGLTDFSGDGVPEVTIASSVEKYFQIYYVLRFDAKKRGLVLLEDAMDKPERAGRFMRLYSNAGRRAIWEEWRYLRWDGDRLFEKASWHDEYPDINIDLHFVRATAQDDSGRAVTFVITDAESDSKQESAYVIKKGRKAYAKIVFAWRKSRADDFDEIEHAYLFEKLTGMSRALYPAREDTVKLDRFEDHGTVRIDGSKDAVRRLSTKR